MKCLCKHCGNKVESEKLLFDIDETGEFIECANVGEEDRVSFSRICAAVKKVPWNPMQFSEEELMERVKEEEKNETIRSIMITISRDRFESRVKWIFLYVAHILKLPVDSEAIPLNQLEKAEMVFEYMCKNQEDYEEQYGSIPSVEFYDIVSRDEELQEDFKKFFRGEFHYPRILYQMPVRLYKEGEQGAVRINKIRKQTGRFLVSHRLCPYCNKKMSIYSGEYEELVLTVLGSGRVSKSTTLSSSIFLFQTRKLRETIPISIQGSIQDEEWMMFKKDFLTAYEKGKKMPPTQTSGNIPMFTVVVRLGRKRKILLTIVDIPGEYNGKDGIDPKVHQQYEALYRNIDCVWYCTDIAEVMQITSDTEYGVQMIEDCGYDRLEDGSIYEPVRLERLSENMGILSALIPKEIPVMLIVGKTDLLKGEERYQDFKLYEPKEIQNWYFKEEGRPMVNGRKLFNRMKGFREFIEQEAGSEFIERFEELYPYHGYCAMSAYGGIPEETEYGLDTYLTELPFIWTLVVKGYMEVQDIYQKKRFFGTKEIIRCTTTSENEQTRNNMCMYSEDRNPVYRNPETI